MNTPNPKKLLRSKWTAVQPVAKEKHFIVTALVAPDDPEGPVERVMIEAVYSGAARPVAWRALRDEAQWRQGWV